MMKRSAPAPSKTDMQTTQAPGSADDNAPSSRCRPVGLAILGAALVLPGLSPAPAAAEGAPEHGLVSFRYLDYRDWQPGLKRIHVAAPSMYFMLPVAGKWSVAGSAVYDSVSGASPRTHSSVSSASRMSDKRTAGDIKLTRYFPRSSYSLTYAYSTERDYDSQAVSATASFATEDNNRTWTFGVGSARDKINPVNNIVTDEKKNTVDLMIGVTQVLTPVDIVQLNVTHAQGRGYFSDPYKQVDNRPRERDQTAALLRWNHHFAGTGHTLRTSYRFYSDSFRVRAHTFTGDYVVPLANGWEISPLARFHSQSAAKFYYDPVYDGTLGAPFPPGYLANPTGFYSADHRLSAFGALTLGFRVSKQLPENWSADLRVEYYQQRGNWRLLGTGSPGLEPFYARLIQLGLNRRL